MPFSQKQNIVPRPKPESYPKVLKTIADHIRAWRIDSHLLQADVARILSVCEDTIVGWEMRGTIPFMRQMPGVIKMIGYFPLNLDTSTFGGRIFYYRNVKGLTPKEFGALIPADASTIRNWEKNKHFLPKRKCRKIEEIIKYRGSSKSRRL